MSVGLRGNLEDFGIAEVFQLIAQQRKTGVLEIAGRSQTVRLAFDDGKVVWASPVGSDEHAALGEMLVRCGLLPPEKLAALQVESGSSARTLPALVVNSTPVTPQQIEEIGDLLTRETLFQVLRWPSGDFHFSAQSVPHERAPETLLSADQILMDGLRMVDEWQTFAADVPSEDQVFERASAFEVYRQKARGDARRRLPQAERVFQLVDGRLSVRRIIDLSRLGTFDATRALSELRQAEAIAPAERARGRAWRPRGPEVRPLGRRIGAAVAAVFPLLLLSVVVSLSFRALPSAESRTGFPIVRQPLAAAHRSFEKRALLHAIEAHRFLFGEWPRDLDAPDRTQLLGRPALTPESSDPYYYATNESGVTLLAPSQ